MFFYGKEDKCNFVDQSAYIYLKTYSKVEYFLFVLSCNSYLVV